MKTREEIMLMHDDTPLTTEETATLLCVSRQTLAKWRSNGAVSLPYRKLGKHVRYRKADVLGFGEWGGE